MLCVQRACAVPCFCSWLFRSDSWVFWSLCIFAAATVAKSLQSCPTLCDPHRRQPTRLPRPWDSPGKNTGVGCHFLLQCLKVKSESEVAQSFPTLSNPMDCSLPGSSVHGTFQARVLEWCHCLLQDSLPTELSGTNLDSISKSRDITFPDKGPSSQSYGFSCSHVWM